MIQLQGVSYSYPDSARPALEGIDLTVPDGEWLLLAGPSGGGKSTLLYVLNGLVPHVLGGEVRGDVEVDGLVPANVPVRELSRRVGTVFQNPEVQLFMLRVGEDVAFGCENLGLLPVETQSRVDRAITQLSLTTLRNQEVFSLSGGQKQRLAIAGALAMGCRTLLLDEPTSDLDDGSRGELLAALCELHRAGHTILMVEHRLEGLDGLVDRVVTIQGGRIASNGVFPTQEPLSRRKPAEYAADSVPLVDLRDVTVAYPGRPPALENLSFCLRAGEVVALLGPNGSGKTTLLKMLCGLLRTCRGHVLIAGKKRPSICDLVGEVGFLFQNPDEQLFADTVVEEIAFGPTNLSRSVEPGRYLDRLGLGRYRDEHPRSLSRGERQRLAAATVLAMRPKLILLDEPTTGLDQCAWATLMEFVVEEAGTFGACVVFSTHHAEVVESFASRVLMLSQGRIINDRLL
jgi:energy-coupling factor transporter ATP-binding protein EcfA2